MTEDGCNIGIGSSYLGGKGAVVATRQLKSSVSKALSCQMPLSHSSDTRLVA